MSWFAKEYLGNNITRITEPDVHPYFSANMFHITGRDVDLMIDFGMGISPLFPELQIEAGKPVIAVATHIHADHIGGFHEFSTRLGHPAEAEEFASMREEDTLLSVFRKLPHPVVRLPTPFWSATDYAIEAAPLTKTIDEGDVIDLGDRCFKVLHMPGHTYGSICLIDEAEKIIFTGDVIYAGGLVDNLPCSNRELYKMTMHRLRSLDIRLAYGGHGETMTGDQMKEIASAYIEGNSRIAVL